MNVFGGVAVSITFTHSVGFNAAKYSAALRTSSSDLTFAIGPMRSASLRFGLPNHEEGSEHASEDADATGRVRSEDWADHGGSPPPVSTLASHSRRRSALSYSGDGNDVYQEQKDPPGRSGSSSSAECFLRVARRMSRTFFPAVSPARNSVSSFATSMHHDEARIPRSQRSLNPILRMLTDMSQARA